MWRAGLPALGDEAAPQTATAVYLKHRGDFTGAASRPNAGKPARHRGCGLPQGRGGQKVVRMPNCTLRPGAGAISRRIELA